MSEVFPVINENKEHELAFYIPKESLQQVLRAPLTHQSTVIITQAWLVEQALPMAILKTRIRKSQPVSMGFIKALAPEYTYDTKYYLHGGEDLQGAKAPSRIEISSGISEAEYNTILSLYDNIEVVSKTRLVANDGDTGIVYYFDVYANRGLVTVEVEFKNKAAMERFVVPTWLSSNSVPKDWSGES